jgi:dipeptidyl aminopeptidase/acylaminoacyl peptidase
MQNKSNCRFWLPPRRRASEYFAFALASVVTIASASARPWTLTDAVESPFMDDVQLAPNGSIALVEIDRTDLSKNSFTTQYERVVVPTGSATPLPSDLVHARWSPDSRSVAWIAPIKGVSTLVLTDPLGGRRRVIPSGGRDVVAFAWSPDGRTIAAIETSQPAKSGGRLFWFTGETDYHGTRPPRRTLWIVDVASATQREITKSWDSWSYGGPVTDHDPSWSPNGARVAVVRQPTPVYGDFEHAQYVSVDVRNESTANCSTCSYLIQEVNHPFFAYPNSAPPAFGSDGMLAYTHTWDGNLASREDVFVNGRDVSASLDRDLWSCSGGSLTWQSGMLLVNLLDGVAMRLFKLDPTGAAAPKALTPDDGSVIAYSIARDGTIAYIWTSGERLPELYLLAHDGVTRQVTHLLHVAAGLPVAQTRTFSWSDGAAHTLHGLLTLPTSGAAPSPPLVVEPHGGPQCADQIGFDGIAQYLASNGYAYFRPDPPGSDGYGDWSYKAIVGNWGSLPMNADFAGVDALFSAGLADPKRTFIEGGSYGGYLTAWIVTHSDRFRAAVAQVPVTNLELEYTLSESPNILRRFFGDKPATDPTLLAQQSPLSYVSQERTPLLLVIGLRDTRAPYVQAIEFYKALAESGAPVRLLADPLAGHGPDDPQGFLEWWSATAAWFARYGGLALPDAKLP